MANVDQHQIRTVHTIDPSGKDATLTIEPPFRD